MGASSSTSEIKTMPTYYVATLASYVLVDAENEDHARVLGLADLHELHPERTAPFTICTVRLSTEEERKLMAWHHMKVAADGQ